MVDLDRVPAPIDKRIDGQSLARINHAVEDGILSVQIRDGGF